MRATCSSRRSEKKRAVNSEASATQKTKSIARIDRKDEGGRSFPVAVPCGTERQPAVNSCALVTRDVESFILKTRRARGNSSKSYAASHCLATSRRECGSREKTQILSRKGGNAKRREAKPLGVCLVTRLAFSYAQQDGTPRVGFEPTTRRLTAGCSTIELPRNEQRPPHQYTIFDSDSALFHQDRSVNCGKNLLPWSTTILYRRCVIELGSRSSNP